MLGILTYTAGGKSAGFNAVYEKYVFLFVSLKAVDVEFFVGVVAKPLCDAVTP